MTLELNFRTAIYYAINTFIVSAVALIFIFSFFAVAIWYFPADEYSEIILSTIRISLLLAGIGFIVGLMEKKKRCDKWFWK